MNIIIDGYNLLKQLFTNKTISEQERSRFIKKAADYAHKKNHTLYIVVDAGPYQRITKEHHGPVVVIYSGYKDSADDVIRRYAEEQMLKNMLVVTTDRELNAWVDQLGVPSIDSLDFYGFMKEQAPTVGGFKKVSGAAQKLRPEESSDELDMLMQEGSQVLQYKQEEDEEDEVSKRVSRNERRLLAILKKL